MGGHGPAQLARRMAASGAPTHEIMAQGRWNTAGMGRNLYARKGSGTVETANRLHDIIESELEVLAGMKNRRWEFGGDPVDKSARLANLATAFKDTAAARLMALGKAESDYE